MDKRSNEVIAKPGSMSVKRVQRHIPLTRLIPPLRDMVDSKAVKGAEASRSKSTFTPLWSFPILNLKIRGILPLPLTQQWPFALRPSGHGNSTGKICSSGDDRQYHLEEKKKVNKVIISGMELGEIFRQQEKTRRNERPDYQTLDEAGRAKA